MPKFLSGMVPDQKENIFYEEDFREIEKQVSKFFLPHCFIGAKTGRSLEGIYRFYTPGYTGPIPKEPSPAEDVEYYLCGPPLMTAAAINMLDNLGVPEDNILFDDFGG
jgi:Na+-transporting NADH:ubiquinone oxidoreductase subunit F